MILTCASFLIQTLGHHCLYIEGASTIHPSSVAKVPWTAFFMNGTISFP